MWNYLQSWQIKRNWSLCWCRFCRSLLMQTMPTMYYCRLVLLYAKQTVLWFGAANSRPRLLYQLQKQNILQCHMLFGTRFQFKTSSRKSVACFFYRILLQTFALQFMKTNLSALLIIESLKFAPCTKHIAIKYHHFHSRVQTSFKKMGDIKMKYILTKQQLADIFTKPVDDDCFFKLPHMLCGWWH